MQTAIENGNRTGATLSVQDTVRGGSLKVLLALSSSKEAETDALRKKLGLSDEQYGSIVDDLQQRYMVDVVSYLDGRRVIETLRLTEFGESALTSAMEKICELPE